MPNILHLSHGFLPVGGLETFVREFINHSTDNNHVIATFGRNNNQLEFNRNIKHIHIESFYEVFNICIENNIDVINIHWTGPESLNGDGVVCLNLKPDDDLVKAWDLKVNPFAPEFYIKLKPGKQLTIDSNPFGVFEVVKLPEWRGKRPGVVVTCHSEFKIPKEYISGFNTEFVINVSDRASETQKHLEVPQKTIYNGIDLSTIPTFNPDPLNSYGDNVFWTGRLEKYDPECYKATLESCYCQSLDFHYYGAGKVSDIERSNHKFLGQIPPEKVKESLLSVRGSIFLYPTLVDSFGLSVLEAMALGLPVVCSPVVSEVVGESALVAYSPNQYVELLRLLSNPDVYRFYQIAGFNRSRQFTIQKTVKNYNMVYDEAIREVKRKTFNPLDIVNRYYNNSNTITNQNSTLTEFTKTHS